MIQSDAAGWQANVRVEPPQITLTPNKNLSAVGSNDLLALHNCP
jgi:hypothetical protein